jgi:hypothetical protein
VISLKLSEIEEEGVKEEEIEGEVKDVDPQADNKNTNRVNGNV